MTLIKFEDVSFSYGSRKILEDINFEINSGDYIYILGENGSGKTTLLKGLLGLKTPSSGSIIMEDLEQNEIGYIPQQKDINRDFPASVFEIVLSGRLTNKGRALSYSAEDKKVACSNMEKLGILSLKNRPYRALSGGQQQKVLISRALCATKKILVLDEPDTGLDMETKEELYGLLCRLNREDRISIVMVTHDVRAHMRNGNSIFHVENGSLYVEKLGDDMRTEGCVKND